MLFQRKRKKENQMPPITKETIKKIRAKKLQDQTDEELKINRTYCLVLIKMSKNNITSRQEMKYLLKIENEILKRREKNG